LPGRCFIKARILQDLDAVAKAVEIIDAGLEKNGDHPNLLYLKGEIILGGARPQHTPAMARQALEKAVALRDDVAIYHFRLSMAYDLERMPQAALNSASRAVALIPQDYYLHQHLGDLYLKYKKLPEAVSAFSESLRINPDNPLLLNNYAYTLLELNRDLPQALEMAKMSVEKMPGLVFNLDTLAWAYYKNRLFAEALEIMNAVFHGRNEVSPEVDFHYAMILYALGTLNDPVGAMDRLLAKPEIAADHALFLQIYDARASIIADLDQKKTTEPAISVESESAE
jgi:tetratricopeptide (TPR) repeat protein